ncbi:hypothetical protein BJ508DRAFT_311226 [Ascobolus immersus RN42]|uniref:Uncharacterized protein n=1 Tax=Ascobolus immersus RN42 TaxID=1160509 RepID=A0A3N4HR49_ASCIM|nr:hypothetical protein BJ508DRAFT_311226 [Ascobolus immersus RN42]
MVQLTKLTTSVAFLTLLTLSLAAPAPAPAPQTPSQPPLEELHSLLDPQSTRSSDDVDLPHHKEHARARNALSGILQDSEGPGRRHRLRNLLRRIGDLERSSWGDATLEALGRLVGPPAIIVDPYGAPERHRHWEYLERHHPEAHLQDMDILSIEEARLEDMDILSLEEALAEGPAPQGRHAFEEERPLLLGSEMSRLPRRRPWKIEHRLLAPFRVPEVEKEEGYEQLEESEMEPVLDAEDDGSREPLILDLGGNAHQQERSPSRRHGQGGQRAFFLGG